MSSSYLSYNGQLHPSAALLISPDNRSFRYGDGFFETMKMINGQIVLEDLHLERLFHSLQIMQFDKPEYFTPSYITQQIQLLTHKNEHQQLARVRVMIFRGNGNLYDMEDNDPNYLIQSWELHEFPCYNEEGLTTAIYKDAHKTIDAFSHIKSNNYLTYAMAARWCKKTGLDDALIMNCFERIAEGTTSNVFIIKDNIIKTPLLSEGCIAGVVRNYLISCFKQSTIRFEEIKITETDVLNADEIFLTNAGFYIKWIKQCGNKIYTNALSKQLYQQFIVPYLKAYEK